MSWVCPPRTVDALTEPRVLLEVETQCVLGKQEAEVGARDARIQKVNFIKPVCR